MTIHLVMENGASFRSTAGLRDWLFARSSGMLVESAALDMHAYIIQCNDRQYVDSRIRAPAKDSWERDVLRVKGGVTDYGVIGVQTLRQFQSSYRSPAKPFKSVPDGFEIDFGRKILPAGDRE